MVNILLVEDDQNISEGLKYYLEKEGYQITIAKGKQDTLAIIANTKYKLVLLDITLKDSNGYELFNEIKKVQNVPIIFLTALDDEINVIKGFELGADDYITKPFRVSELLLRIKAVLRRCNEYLEEIIINDLKIDLNKAKVYKSNKLVDLTALEYKLLVILTNNLGKVLTRNAILESIWDSAGEYVNDNTLTVYIKRLREKIEDDIENPKLIHTIRGIGYKLGE